MLQQIQIKYMTALRQGTELRPEDLGAVRLAMRMAMEELHLQYRHDLADMDDIIADLLTERDQLKATAAMDASEVLRLQTMEDRLITWVHEHAPEMSDTLIQTDTAAVVIDLLTKRGGAVAPPPAPVAVNGNGHENGKVQITDLGTRYTGRRLNVSDEELEDLAKRKILWLASQLGRTPTQRDWAANIQPDEPSLTSVKNRLKKSWNQLVAAAGLTPNPNSHQVAAQAAAEQGQEAKAENAEAPFRGQ